MSITSPAPALLDGRASGGDRALLRTLPWLLGSLATAGGLFGLTALIAAENERTAGRMIIAAQKGTGYIATAVAGYAASQSRPYRY